MVKTGIYARLSLSDEKSTSTERQRKECREYAKRYDMEVVDEYVDEGISGYKDVERPAFDRAINDLLTGKIDVLLAWKLDRLSRRGFGHLGGILESLEGTGRGIVTAIDNIDTRNEMNRMMVVFMSEIARTESQNTSTRLKAQRRDARERGKKSSGAAPWGMVTLDDGTVAPDPETGHIARDIVLRFLAGEDKMSLVRWLNDNEHFTTRGGLWSHGALGRWMTFPTLAGFVSHNPEKKRYPDPYRSEETGELVKIGEGIITEAEFFEIRSRLKPRTVRTGQYGRKSSAMLSGMLVCGGCGHSLYGANKQYKCGAKQKGINCFNAISRSHIEELMSNLVISRICSFDPSSEIHEKVEDVWRGDGSDHLPAGDSAREEIFLKELEDRRDDLLEERFVRGRFKGKEELFDTMLENVETMIANQQDKVNALLPSRAKGVMDLTDGEIVREAWENATTADRNAVSKVVVRSIKVIPTPNASTGGVFRPERVEVEWLAA